MSPIPFLDVCGKFFRRSFLRTIQLDRRIRAGTRGGPLCRGGVVEGMVGAEKKHMPAADRASPDGTHRAMKSGKGDPVWATGLKQLYDQVVDEPIPDSFKDLLSKLDDASK
ncbi:NepR family anti-sigma factor [Croceibacterium sp. TMG7-5b_MA50]|uniref:NepR family anti-sigma factor n=1 Tax=Croceibacterium sp. TMG7-5b_MA50 TaxID=3121290 RepID=UPI0032220FC1